MIKALLVTQTQGGKMVGSDVSTELWLHPLQQQCLWPNYQVFETKCQMTEESLVTQKIIFLPLPVVESKPEQTL